MENREKRGKMIQVGKETTDKLEKNKKQSNKKKTNGTTITQNGMLLPCKNASPAYTRLDHS